MLFEFLGILLEFDLTLDELLVLACPIDLAGLLVLELNEIILRHKGIFMVSTGYQK